MRRRPRRLPHKQRGSLLLSARTVFSLAKVLSLDISMYAGLACRLRPSRLEGELLGDEYDHER